MALYTTTSHKFIKCPKWNIEISLCGKYKLNNDTNSTFASFMYATCPIIENSKLPYYKQDNKYKAMHCDGNCELLNSFKNTIDISKGYSQ